MDSKTKETIKDGLITVGEVAVVILVETVAEKWEQEDN